MDNVAKYLIAGMIVEAKARKANAGGVNYADRVERCDKVAARLMRLRDAAQAALDTHILSRAENGR